MGIEALNDEIGRRRVMAIISHPDAGKTTITEKLSAIRQPDSGGRLGKGQERPIKSRDIGLDGDGAAARHLGHLIGDAVSVSGTAW